jgi:hypothetical protein
MGILFVKMKILFQAELSLFGIVLSKNDHESTFIFPKHTTYELYIRRFRKYLPI